MGRISISARNSMRIDHYSIISHIDNKAVEVGNGYEIDQA